MEEDGLGLVVAGVARDHDGAHVSRHGKQDAVTQPPRGRLDALSLPPQLGDVHREERVRDAEPGGQGGAETGVDEPGLAAQAVHDVEGGDRDAAGSSPAVGEQEERRRIASARAGHGEPADSLEEAGGGQVPGESDGQSLGHAALSSALRPGLRDRSGGVAQMARAGVS